LRDAGIIKSRFDEIKSSGRVLRGIHCIINARFENQKQRNNMRAREGKRAHRCPPPGSSGFGPQEEGGRGGGHPSGAVSGAALEACGCHRNFPRGRRTADDEDAPPRDVGRQAASERRERGKPRAHRVPESAAS